MVSEKKQAQTGGLLGFVVASVASSAVVFVVLLLAVLPPGTLWTTMGSLRELPSAARDSVPYLVQLGVIATMISLMGLGLVRAALRRDRKQLRMVVARRGTVITETLITLPPFFLLCFGLSQQSINSIAQILGNVAIHRAAHSVWVWEPERAHNTGRAGTVNFQDRACIAVANVMAPVAPGDFASFSLSSPSEEMKAQRYALARSILPPVGNNIDLGFITNSLSTLNTVASVAGGGRHNSIARALDDSGFAERSVFKFTAAYRACEVTVNTNTTVQQRASSGGGGGGGSTLSVPGYSVQMKYYHHQAMPLVGRFFSGWWNQIPFTNQYIEFGTSAPEAVNIWNKTGRYMVHFITISRTLQWPKQAIKPNKLMPNNTGDGSSGGDPSTDLRGTVGD